MKRDNHNTVDVKVGRFIRNWVVSTYDTDCIKLDKDMNLWSIIKQNLELLPNDYQPLPDREEYITFVLLADGKDTLAYDAKKNREYRVNTLYRCSLSMKGENIIRRYLTKQFKHTFHNYMKGALNNNDSLSITEAITEFLTDSKQEVSETVVSTLSKDWYRYRRKYPDEFNIPIFF
jgi:hypothetical protein